MSKLETSDFDEGEAGRPAPNSPCHPREGEDPVNAVWNNSGWCLLDARRRGHDTACGMAFGSANHILHRFKGTASSPACHSHPSSVKISARFRATLGANTIASTAAAAISSPALIGRSKKTI